MQQLGPSSTTISSAAGMFYARPRPGRRRLPFVLGGLVITGAFIAIAIVLSGGDSVPPKPQISYADIVASAPPEGAAGIEEAAPTPPPPPVAADDAEAMEIKSEDVIEAECRRFQEERKWAELAQCADRLAPHATGRAAELKHSAAEELKAAPRIEAFADALRTRHLRRAKAELDQVWPQSVAYPELKREYEAAEAQAITALAAELRQVADSDCMEYRDFLAKKRIAMPASVLDAAARRTPCTPAKKCDAEALAKQGYAEYLKGQLAPALALYDRAYACKASPDYAQKSLLITCNQRDLAKARLYWKRLARSHSLSLQTQALTICMRNGITEAQLNAP